MIEIVTADCRVFSGTADVMITDPPYRAHVHASAVSQSAARGARSRDLGFAHLSSPLRRSVATIAATGVRRWSVIFSDVESLWLWRLSCETAGARYIRPVPWVRWSMPQLSGDRPPTGCEFVSVFHGAAKGKKHWNGPGNLTHLAHKCLRGEGKHKAEKPLDLMLDLVDWFSDPGELVIDPFVGSGTTALACKLLGRDFAGTEINAEWAARARARVAAPKLSARDEERYRRWSESRVEK